MDPVLGSALVAAIGVAGGIWAGWSARKRVAAETGKALAERDNVSVATATSAVELANLQMARLTAEQDALRATVEAYRRQVEKATAAEVTLRMELGKVKKRVAVLEEYIKNAGLPLPDTN